MRIISFLTGTNIILLCSSLMIIINYFIELNNICSGSCFFNHFFKNQFRVLFFLFIVNSILLILYFQASFKIKKLNLAQNGYAQTSLSKSTKRTLKIISIFVSIQLVLFIISNIQQKNEADQLQVIDCSGNSDPDQCSFVRANHSVITTGKILMIAFIILHAVLYICGFRILNSPSQRVQQISEDRSSEVNNNQINVIQQQRHVNAIIAIPTQDQERNLIQGQNLEQMPHNAIFSHKAFIPQDQCQKNQQNKIQIGEAVLL
ncbi:hypothetical protein ABPG72_015863 [Tetrahymena utriculariae]